MVFLFMSSLSNVTRLFHLQDLDKEDGLEFKELLMESGFNWLGKVPCILHIYNNINDLDMKLPVTYVSILQSNHIIRIYKTEKGLINTKSKILYFILKK